MILWQGVLRIWKRHTFRQKKNTHKTFHIWNMEWKRWMKRNNTFALLAFVVNEYIVYTGLGKHALHVIKTFYLIAVETNQILAAQLCLLRCLSRLCSGLYLWSNGKSDYFKCLVFAGRKWLNTWLNIIGFYQGWIS